MIGRIALVTGASRGIGAAIARDLAAVGFRVGCNSRSGCAELAAEIDGVDAVGDISTDAGVAAAFEATESGFDGKVEVLVNNAGVNRDGVFVRMSDEAWQHVIDTNLTGMMRACRRSVRSMMRARWGRIINISSVSGIVGVPGQTNYAAAKAGIIGFSKSLAKELATRNVTVNVVAPGFIDTEMTAALNDAQRERALIEIPAGRFGTPDEVATAVSFLASERASYVTGSVIIVAGGMSS